MYFSSSVILVKVFQFHVGDKESVVAEGTDYYLSVMFHHKNHLTRSLTREATGVRLEPGLT